MATLDISGKCLQFTKIRSSLRNKVDFYLSKINLIFFNSTIVSRYNVFVYFGQSQELERSYNPARIKECHAVHTNSYSFVSEVCSYIRQSSVRLLNQAGRNIIRAILNLWKYREPNPLRIVFDQLCVFKLLCVGRLLNHYYMRLLGPRIDVLPSHSVQNRSSGYPRPKMIVL